MWAQKGDGYLENCREVEEAEDKSNQKYDPQKVPCIADHSYAFMEELQHASWLRSKNYHATAWILIEILHQQIIQRAQATNSDDEESQTGYSRSLLERMEELHDLQEAADADQPLGNLARQSQP